MTLAKFNRFCVRNGFSAQIDGDSQTAAIIRSDGQFYMRVKLK